ncbi:MAG: 50S ribosomal protein L18Ae [Candidatus Bathyarchaeia archaeon]
MDKAEVRTYRVVGEIRKPLFRIPFKKSVRALSRAEALDKVLSEVGSKHKAKRFEVKIIAAEELRDDGSGG